MNLFRLAGDMTHLLSIVVLLLKINATRSCRGGVLAVIWGQTCWPAALLCCLSCGWPGGAGISLKTQELYALVFVCRYLDLFTNFISVWVFEAPPSLGPFHFSSSFPLNLVHAGTTPS